MNNKSIVAVSLLSISLLLSSCGEKNQNIEIGKEFKVYESPITILKLEETKVLRSEKDSMVLIAPKGKKYVYLEVKNPKNEMIFIKAFSKTAEVKHDENVALAYFSHNIDAGFTDDFFIIDENASLDKVLITNPSDEEFTLTNPKSSKLTNTISAESQKIVDSYSTEIGLLQGFAPFIVDGKDVVTFANNQGELPINRMSMSAEVHYFSADGKKYIYYITDILKNISKVTATWENGKITSLLVEEI